MATETETIPKEKKKDGPKDVVGLYMGIRQDIASSTDEYEQYGYLMESINVGSSLLGIDDEIHKEVENALDSEKTTPTNYKMDWMAAQKTYRLSLISGSTSSVNVLKDELSIGERCIKNMLASQLISKYKSLDKKIFNKLVRGEIIPRNREETRDVFLRNFKKQIQEEDNGNST